MKFLSRLLPFTLFAPLFAFAAVGNFGEAKTFVSGFIDFMNGTLVPAIFGLAILVFLWGMFNTFILGGDDEEKQTKGKQLMMYSIAGFVLMIGIWGVVNIVASSLGINGAQLNDAQLPKLPRSTN
jgi:hypothetical protein